jgi:hypothetical protein
VVINWLFDNLSLCITDGYYPKISHNLPSGFFKKRKKLVNTGTYQNSRLCSLHDGPALQLVKKFGPTRLKQYALG